VNAVARRRQLLEVVDGLLVVDQLPVRSDREAERGFRGRDSRPLREGGGGGADKERDGGANWYRAPAGCPQHSRAPGWRIDRFEDARKRFSPPVRGSRLRVTLSD